MCQTPFLVKIVSDHFLANQKRVRHLFKCQNWPKFPGVDVWSVSITAYLSNETSPLIITAVMSIGWRGPRDRKEGPLGWS